MLRAVISISQRGKHPITLLSAKSVVQAKLRNSHAYSRPLVRCFASNDNKIKGSVVGNPSGIVGNLGKSTTVGNVSGADPTACGQAQTAVLGNESKRDSDFGKQTDVKRGTATSQMHATPTVTMCGKIDDDSKSKKVESSKNVGTTAGKPVSSNKLADDTMKQLQEVAANLPSKEQVEKFVFRVVAFIYDIVYLTGNWTIRFVNEKILQNSTFKYYWKRFHEKMEQAKKD